jgi:adenylosuccinate synthase
MDPLVSRLVLVVGGQFGSEGKGAVCAALARSAGGLIAVRTGAHNAGHTVYDTHRNRWTFRQVPSAAVVRRDAELVIAAGSEVNPETLQMECDTADAAGYNVSSRLQIDRSASVLTQEHIDREGGYGGHLTRRIGSTGKGVGACRADRVARTVELYGGDFDSQEYLRHAYLAGGRTILVEGSQGYGLGLHSDWYPHCTSRDCRAIDDLAAIGLLPLVMPEIWVVLRSYPIRVANPKEGGGTSGLLNNELAWDELARRTHGYVRPEQTTVTKQQRRIGEWDSELARRAVAANGGEHARVALTMFDYWYPELAGATTLAELAPAHLDRIRSLESELGAPVAMVGTGPATAIRLPLAAAVAA